MSMLLCGELEDSRTLNLVDWGWGKTHFSQDGHGVLDIFDMNAPLICKWIFQFMNEHRPLLCMVVCARSGIDPNKMILNLSHHSNRASIWLHFYAIFLNHNKQSTAMAN